MPTIFVGIFQHISGADEVTGWLGRDIGLKSHRQPHVGAAKSPMVKKVAFASLFTLAIALLCAAVNAQQFPIMDRIADKVIQKYQTSTCEQLWQERAQKGKAAKPQMEQEALQMLKSDPQMRAAFINKVAAPIANKMFECGMIP